jgi:hypothetical protein
VLAAGFLLWRYFAAQSERYWVGLLLAGGFVPGWFALIVGQINPWLLAGVVGFLWAQRKRSDLAAGAALALLTIKPHVTYLFFLAALYWIARKGRWRIPIGMLAALAGASGIVLLVNRDIFGSYLGAAANPPLFWATPTLGTWLRLLFGVERNWLQFLPSLVGALGLLAWLWRRRGPWHWEVLAGPLLLVSVATAAYGWSHDQVVLLPVVVAAASQLRGSARGLRAAGLGLLAASQLALLIQKLHHVAEVFSVWHAWALTALYAWVAARARGHGDR